MAIAETSLTVPLVSGRQRLLDSLIVMYRESGEDVYLVLIEILSKEIMNNGTNES